MPICAENGDTCPTYKKEGETSVVLLICYTECESSPITGLVCPRGFQEVKVPRFHDNGTGWW